LVDSIEGFLVKKNESSAGRILQSYNQPLVRNLVHDVMSFKSPHEIRKFLDDAQKSRNAGATIFDTKPEILLR